MKEGPEPGLETAVAINISDPVLRNDIRSLAVSISGFVVVASREEADVVVTDRLDDVDEAVVVIGDAEAMAAAIGRGLAGLLRHQIDGERLRIAVEAAQRGLVCVPRATALRWSGTGRRPEDAGEESGPVLSIRERQVLEVMAAGASNKAIARRLGISVHTAKFHVASVIAKLGATGRTDAVAQAMRLGLVHL